MRLLLLLSLPVAATHALLSRRALVSTYNKCTAAQTKAFIENLSAASDGCMVSTSYVWDGSADPTDAQRAAMCQCTVEPFSVPKCYWTKLGQYNIDTAVHFGFVYNCASISGKTTPRVTELDATTIATTATPVPTTATPKATVVKTTENTSSPPTASTTSDASTATSPDCTVKQLNAFTGALNTASSGCTTNSSFIWGGSANPTETQYSEICRCAAVTAFTIPACSIQKGKTRVSLAEHYTWVTSVQCPTFSPSMTVAVEKKSSSKVGLAVGISGIVVAVVVVLVVAILLYARHRKGKKKQQLQQQQQYRRHEDRNNMFSPLQYYQPRLTSPPRHNTNTV